MVTEMLTDGWVAATAALVLTIGLTVLSMDGPRWAAKFASRFRDYTLRSCLYNNYYRKRPKSELYELVPSLALRRQVDGRGKRYVLRAQQVARLPLERRQCAVRAARAWVMTVGRFACEAGVARLPLRPFLQTNHLALIREGAITLPIVLLLMSRDQLSDDELDYAFWGAGMMELAVRYNRISRVQRASVYFKGARDEPPIGPVLRAGPSRFILYWNLKDRLSTKMPLRRRRFRASRKYLERLAREVPRQA